MNTAFPAHKFIRKSCFHVFVLTVFCLLFSFSAFSKTLLVGSGQKFKTIKSAIAAAQNGDEIIVKKGVYKEGEIIITKSLVLSGENLPVIDGGNKYEMLQIGADGVVIKGFVLQNSGAGSIKDIAAISLFKVRNCKILGNTFKNNFFGIHISGSNHCVIKDNIITGNHTTESNSGNGIHLWKTDSSEIINNTISGHRDGIYFEFVTNTKIIQNKSIGNIRYGLHFMFSNGNVYEKNIFRKNGAGVAVMFTTHIVMRDNIFELNWGGASYGLLLKSITNSIIEHNLFLQNTVGIYMEGSDKLLVRNNEFRNNGYALKIMANCIEDTLLANNFISNTFDVSTNGSLNLSLFEGNYWDKYAGYDLDKNKIGDVPYRPVSLFSMIIEKVPNSVLLLRSMVSEILDQVERVMPDVIPASLVDNKPVMKELKLTRPSWKMSLKGR